MKKFIIMDPYDSCATALKNIPKYTQLNVNEKKINITNDIPFGHKFALEDIKKGEKVKKYGQSIGIATENIKKGDWIHTHNLISHYITELLKNE